MCRLPSAVCRLPSALCCYAPTLHITLAEVDAVSQFASFVEGRGESHRHCADDAGGPGFGPVDCFWTGRSGLRALFARAGRVAIRADLFLPTPVAA